VQAALFHTLALICPAKHVLCRDESIIIIIIIQQLMRATITGKGAAETERVFMPHSENYENGHSNDAG